MISNVEDDKTKETRVTELVYRSPPTDILRKNSELNSPKNNVKKCINQCPKENFNFNQENEKHDSYTGARFTRFIKRF